MGVELMNEPPVRAAIRRSTRTSIHFTLKLLHKFLAEKKKEGLSQKSLVTYSWNLTGFYDFLGEDRRISGQRSNMPT